MSLDIEKYFDTINHEWMIKNLPIPQEFLTQWLKAGVILPNKSYEEIESGTPQGGTISPLLSNMVLDGLTEKVKSSVEHLKRRRPKHWSPQVNVIRFADDVLITGASQKVLRQIVKPVVIEFLNERGLKLNENKTTITNIKAGFNFLGFYFRAYPDKKHPKG